MTDESFADRIGDISITGTTVRIDLVSLSPIDKGEDGQPAMRFRQRVVLPLEGFVRSHEIMQRMMDYLVAQGVVARDGVAAPSQEAIAVPNGATPASPNFPA